MGRVALAAAAAAALVAGTGCGERTEPVENPPSLYPVSVHGGGDRATVVGKRPVRVAAVSAGPERVLRALGAGRQLLPSDRFGDLDSRDFVEELVRQRPDLIVATAADDTLALRRVARATGAPVYLVAATTVREAERAYSHLGLLTDHPVAARRLIRATEAARAALERRLGRARAVRVFVDVGGTATVSTRTLISALIEEARGRNVAGPTPEPGPFSLAKLAKLDPEVYLALRGSGTTLRELRRDRRTRNIRAVRDGRFHVIDATLLEISPRLDQSLELLVRLLHPDAAR